MRKPRPSLVRRVWRVRGYRRIVLAALISILIGVTLYGLTRLTQWGGWTARQSDTRQAVTQAGQQLLRAFISRRGTLTFIRDTLDRRADLTLAQLQAMGTSATEHTRHLLGIGLLRAGRVTWWFEPRLPRAEMARLLKSLGQRSRLPGVWRHPSTFHVAPESTRPLLVMLEPLKSEPYRSTAIVGVFDVGPLLEDFFASLTERHPAEVLEDELLVYRSGDWQAASPEVPVASYPLSMDAVRWTVRMQAGATRVAQTLSWLTVLVMALSIIAGLGVITLVWILAARTWILQQAVARRTAALRRTMERLHQLATTDELTGLYNRRFFLSRWSWECERSRRYRRPLSCLMIDVNGFKQVNDQLGHAAGDRLLRQVAEALKGLLRQSDILARFGGDEFIVALPETPAPQADLVAGKLRQLHIPVGGSDGRVAPVRLSVGVGWNHGGDRASEDIIQDADQALYADKRMNREQRHAPSLA